MLWTHFSGSNLSSVSGILWDFPFGFRRERLPLDPTSIPQDSASRQVFTLDLRLQSVKEGVSQMLLKV